MFDFIITNIVKFFSIAEARPSIWYFCNEEYYDCTYKNDVIAKMHEKLGFILFYLPEIFFISVLLILLCVYVFQLEYANSVKFIKRYILVIIITLLIMGFAYWHLYWFNNSHHAQIIYFWGKEVNDNFFNSQIAFEGYNVSFKALTIFIALSFFIVLYGVIQYYPFIQVEHLLLMCLSIFGSLILMDANDLLIFYLALEISTIPLYILVASKTRCNFSTEAGLKYFIMGSFSSGLILFGFSYIYGFTGLTSLTDLAIYFRFLSFESGHNIFIILGVLLFVIGLFIKIGIAPFHLWVVDVYAGAPLVITFFMLTVPKVVLWGVSFNWLLWVCYPLYNNYLSYLLIICVVASFFFGIFPGLYQIKIKRLLIYSSIASNGFFLLAFLCGNHSILYGYLLIYLITSSGFFAFYFLLRNQSNLKLITKISELNNYYQVQPALAYFGSILLFSMAGIPPLAGFYAKYYLFINAFDEVPALVFISVLFSCASTFYYIRICKWMFFVNNLSPAAKNGWLFLVSPNRLLVCYLIFAVIFNLTLCLYFSKFVMAMHWVFQ